MHSNGRLPLLVNPSLRLPSVDPSNSSIQREKEPEVTQRNIETERERKREKETQTQRDTERHREGDRERERNRQRESEGEREREGERECLDALRTNRIYLTLATLPDKVNFLHPG